MPELDVCLVSMPYTDIERPSLAIGLLTAILRREGISARGVYPCIAFAESVGAVDYYRIAKLPLESMVCDWTFAPSVFPELASRADDAFLHRATCPRHIDPEVWPEVGADLLRAVRAVREVTAAFVDRVAREVLALQPRIVGCTSVFQQQIASLALLKRIRELDPSVVTMIGGSNCEGPMGLATRRNFDFVDFVVSGEADELIVPLCRTILNEGREAADRNLPFGVFGSDAAATRAGSEAPRASVDALDALPVPEYDDYFEAVGASALGSYLEPGPLAETSRGCWWGAKSHCTFCGLNGSSMAFRAKSPSRVFEELDALATRYGKTRFEMVDNILDTTYFDTVLPRLAERNPKLELFYEVKANLKRRHVELLAAAGVRQIQPGLESMSDEVLRLFAKGTTAAINVQLLKWAAESGVHVTWIAIYGVPGERDAWYESMLEWLPLIRHLQPPDHATPVQFHRFSPYHRDAARWGLELAPAPGYAAVYPFADEELRDIAYLFEDPQDRTSSPVLQRFVSEIAAWRDDYWYAPDAQKQELVMTDGGGMILIRDSRRVRVHDLHMLTGVEADVYRICDAATAADAIAGALAGIPREQVDAALAELRRRRLVLDVSGRILALATRPRESERSTFVGGTFHLDRYAQEHLPA